ncbi:MAG: hypothetical protein HY956_00430 [Deltaproteobacteria bacterium]|nr:hypothetical protein [Deltaproteobacteria bacterium]
MKKMLYSLFAVSATAFFCASSQAASVNDYPAGLAASGIANSRHNMGSMGRVITTDATTEVCVFCHTPHFSNTSNNLSPLWNRNTSAPTSFTAYGETLGGSSIANVGIGGSTLACLSCHDGVTSWDDLLNTPGKGWTPYGTNRWWMPGQVEPLIFSHFGSTICAACHTDTLGWSENPATRLNLGLDLRNDHPVSVDYIPDRAGLRPTNTTINAIDLTSELASSASTAFSGNLAQNRWAVKGFISDTATISNLLRNGKVECSSCHDPHFRNLSWDEAEPTWNDEGGLITYCTAGEDCSDGNFLRRIGGNTGSGICRTCHEK